MTDIRALTLVKAANEGFFVEDRNLNRPYDATSILFCGSLEGALNFMGTQMRPQAQPAAEPQNSEEFKKYMMQSRNDWRP